MKIFLQCVMIIGLSATAALSVYFFHPERPPLYFNPDHLAEGEVEVDKVIKWLEQGEVVWIDARSAFRYEQGHVEGAFLLNEREDFNALLLPIYSQLANRADLPFVVYCGSESCLASKRVADLLRNRVGITDVFVLKGGVKVLQDKGLMP